MIRKFERRFSKEKSVGKKTQGTQTGEAGALTHKQAVEKMKEDWRANKKSIDVMRVYMNASREKRREEVNKTNTATLIRRYPALRLEELVSEINPIFLSLLLCLVFFYLTHYPCDLQMLEEFMDCLKIKLTYETMIDNLRKFFPSLIQYLNQNCNSNISDSCNWGK